MKKISVDSKIKIKNRTGLGTGIVNRIRETHFGKEYDIIFEKDGKRIFETFPENLIEPVPDLFEKFNNQNFDPAVDFFLKQLALQVPLENSGGELSNSKVDLLPHQILLTHDIIKNQRRRFLVADEVGLGKTIEAGMIIRELIARKEADRILIITPAGLVANWQTELNECFKIYFEILGRDFRDNNPDAWQRHKKVIASIDTLKKPKRMEKILEGPKWDLIIFDEAHHISRKKYGKKIDPTQNYKFAERIKNYTRDLIFLSATPHQGDSYQYWSLINLLDDQLFESPESMADHRGLLNRVMYRRTKKEVTDAFGNPIFMKRKVHSQEFELSMTEQRFYEKLTAYLKEGYNLAKSDTKKKTMRQRAIGFVMATFQKIMSSSPRAIKQSLRRRLLSVLAKKQLGLEKMDIQKKLKTRTSERRKDISARIMNYQNKMRTIVKDLFEFQNYRPASNIENYLEADAYITKLKKKLSKKAKFDEQVTSWALDALEDETDSLDVDINIPNEENKLKELIELVPKDSDRKFQTLIRAIEQVRRVNPDEKIMLFTQYRETLFYLWDELSKYYNRDKIVTIKGGPLEDKLESVEKFWEPDGAQFLLSTTAGGEGINLQVCKVLFNYDMPWNPMAVEQRIGRIHRYGQVETAQVYNLIALGTIEEKVYKILETKLYKIARTIGKIDEVTGEVTEDFRSEILGFLGSHVNYQEMYKQALIEKDYKRTEREIEESLKKAKLASDALRQLSQDLSTFNLENYKKLEGRYQLKDLKIFAEKAILKLGGSFIPSGELIDITTPPIIMSYSGVSAKYKNSSFNRKIATRKKGVELLGLGHPLIDALIEYYKNDNYPGDVACFNISLSADIVKPFYSIRFITSINFENSSVRHFYNNYFLNSDLNLQSDLKLNDIEILSKINEISNNCKISKINKSLSKRIDEFIKDKEFEYQKEFESIISIRSKIVGLSIFMT